MAGRRWFSRPALAVVTAVATVVSYAGIASPQPARAVDPDTTAFIGLFDDLQGFVPGLAGVGELAQALPTLDVAPGSPAGIGLADLLSQARTSVLGGPTFGGATSVDDFVDAIDGANGSIAGDRNVEFTATKAENGTVQTVTVDVEATKTIGSARLDVNDDDPKFSLGSAGGVSLTLTLNGTFALNYDSATGATWLTRTGSTPSLSVGGSASIPTPGAVSAGLGILGITLGSDTSYTLSATVGAAFADPNNDGRLAFDEVGGTADDGELSAPGAGAGLVTAGITAGSLNATLDIEARPSATISLPDANATVTVSAPDLTTGEPQVTFAAGALDAVNAFLTLSTRDLAQGLAQAAAAVVAMQDATGVNLPFMRGELSDAVAAVEAIQDFLETHVPEPTAGSALPGLPDFLSLQDMLEFLQNETGLPGNADMSIASAAYDAAKKKVDFTLNIARDAGSPQPLDGAGAALSGTATFTDTTLTDATKNFSDELGEAAALAGRQVIAGGSSAVILSASGDTLTLDPAPLGNPSPDVRWLGGKPANGTAYSIQAADPKTGLVEFADTLKTAGAISDANAKVAVADVTPSYDLSLPIVLDLREPNTTDCDPGAGTAACPFAYNDPVSGISRIITSLPLPADRIMLRTGSTPLLTADAPITTGVDVDAVVGFVGLKITGTLKECTTNSAADCTGSTDSDDHLLQIDLKPLDAADGADADGDIPLPAFVAKLATAIAGGTVTDLFDFDVDGQAHASLTLSVPGAPDFFGGATPSVTVTLPDITNPAGVTVTGPELSKLLPLNIDPNNPMALFGALLANLGALQDVIEQIPGGSEGLGTEIPLIGKSFSDIIGSGASGGGTGVTYTGTSITDTGKAFDSSFVGRRVTVGSESTAIVAVPSATTLTLAPPLSVAPPAGTPYRVESELQGLINLLNNQPSESLQQMLETLAAKLGGGSTATFAVENGSPSVLKLVIDWKRLYETQVPVNFDFDLGGDRSIVGAQGTGLINVEANGEVKLTLRIPLSLAAINDPLANLTVDPAGSFIKAGVNIDGDGIRLNANLGPFQASLGDPNLANPAGTELQGGLGVTLANGGGSPMSLSSFVGGLGVDVDNGDGVTCDGAPSGSDKLAFCAVFPTYLNGTAVNADPAKNNFVVRLPLGSDLADTFNLAGPDLDGGNARFVAPDGLATALADAALNLLSFGDGFFGYLQFLENAMRAASFDGKLPLIGKDLQAGADWVGDLRAEIDAAFEAAGVPTDTNAGAIRTFMATKVEPALPSFGNFNLDVTCTTPLQSAAPPSVTPNGGGTGKSYQYKIVAYTNVGGTPTDTLPGDASVAADNAATLDATNFNSMTWTAVDRATGYKVLRAVDGGEFFLLKDVGNTTSYDDDGTDTPAGTAYVPVAGAPCPDSTPADEVTGFTVSVDIGQGDPNATVGCQDSTDPALAAEDKPCLTATVPLDLGIPGLSIKASDATDPVTTKLGWRLHLKMRFDRNEGFLVHTQDSGLPEFRVGASLDVPDTEARLAFLKIESKNNNASVPEFAGAFTIDLRDSASAVDCTTSCAATDAPTLSLDEILSGDVSDFVDPALSAKVDIDWHLDASIDPALPGVATDFEFLWTWASNASPEDATGLQKLDFRDISIDPGTFLGGTIGPIVKQIVDVFKPIQPIIDMIFAPLPVLSDLSRAVGGGDVTIASLAEAFSTIAGGPDLGPFLEVLQTIRSLVSALSGECANPAQTFCIDIGDFSLVKSKALTTDANPATANSLIDTGGSLYNVNNNTLGDLDATTPGNLSDTSADADHPGFTFPVLQNPSSLFGLILGQDVELARFDSGPLTLGFEFQQSFGPVYAPPPVNVVISGGASVTLRIVAGFDTYGIRTAVESGKVDYKILDSLYFVTTDDNGKPIPVVQFEGFLAAGASVSAVVIEVGIIGGIKLTVSFTWNDPNNDGKFRFSEFLATALTNPICLFNVGGELSLFIKVFITLGVSPFSVSFDFELVNIKLLDFSLKPDCTPPPPKLGGTKDGVLYLFAGKYGRTAQRGHSAWDNNNDADETWVVRQHPAKDGNPAKIVVTALGISEEFEDGGISTVVLDGRGYDGDLQVLFSGGEKNVAFDKKTIVFTGDGKDTIRTGEGESWVDGGGEVDKITTLDRTDLSKALPQPAAYVAGGGGADSITVGNAADTILGDGALSFATGSPTVTAADGSTVGLTDIVTSASVPASPGTEAGTDGIDQIAAGLGGSTIYGNGGADIIGTANDNPQADLPTTTNPALYRANANTIVGGAGSDRIKSGSADDEIYTGAKVVIDGDGFGSGDAATDENTVDTGTGSDTVYGSNAKDFVTTHSLTAQTATVFGGDSDDVVIGGNGTDKLYGGPANDYLVAQPATVSSDFPVSDVLGSARKVTLLSTEPLTVAKTLVGGGGSDRIYGADGPATIYGDHEVDACVLQSDPVSKQPPEHPTETGPVSGHDADDLILGGDGVDMVQAGGGNDHVFLYASADVACGNKGIDEIFGGTENDLVYGGSDGDKLYGDAHDDQLYANTGDDAAYGGLGDDRVQGNDGTDFLTGDTGVDLVIGGTSKAGEPDTGDQIYGDTGVDTLIGDNADSDVIPAYPVDLANTDLAAGGDDRIWGGDQGDLAYGGIDDDEIWGGAHADRIEGNPATDTVHGEGDADNVIGGSSQESSPGTGVGWPDANDILDGGSEDDVITGDNAVLVTVGSGSPLTKGRLMTERTITPHDLGHGAATGLFGGDSITGGAGTDVILGQRGIDTISGGTEADYAEGGQDSDTIDGDGADDDLVGGSYHAHSGTGQATVGQLDTGDTIRGLADGDVALGDNGALLRDPAVPASDLTKDRAIAERSIQPYDLGLTPVAGTSGADLVYGGTGRDVLLGQSGTDRILGEEHSDYAEGGPDTDWVEGGTGSDDLVGGSSTIDGADTGLTAQGQPDAADVLWGQGDDDLVTGDNALVNRVAPHHDLTYRVGSAGQIVERRSLRLLDLSNTPSGELSAPIAARFGGDYISGQGGVDVLLGQDGPDTISGGSADDYAEGQGANDLIHGDSSLAAMGVVLPVVAWPGLPTPGYAGDGGADGQDDLLGGSSRPGFRDGADEIHGNGVSDFILGDNGVAVRDVLDNAGSFTDRIYTLRYPATLPAGAAVVRTSGPDQVSTRFCTTAQATCEVAGAFGGDLLYGEGGDDFIYGQDGDDQAWGGDNDDDIYGELGNDRLFGEAGEDAILGDRGGIRDVRQDGSNAFNITNSQVPKIVFDGFQAGTVTRVVDLLHDVDGDAFVGAGLDPAMPHPGLNEGGDDRIRGGGDHDSIHAGFGDDLANGDSGGDWMFGDDGADVMWGGRGNPDVNGDPNARGAGDSYVDYLIGGKGGSSPTSLAGGSGADVLDWRPRGSYNPGTGCTTNTWPADVVVGKKAVGTIDPCTWFEMTDIVGSDPAAYQHHQGIDWMYGSWDRDVLQGDVADNGPNLGDRLLDWNGAYNIYTHCNAAYGGFNDVRQHSPDMQSFLERWTYALGGGQSSTDATTNGTSAFVELSIAFPGVDNAHSSGSAFPGTPGHFDSPNACAP